jgi:hypothetical protein
VIRYIANYLSAVPPVFIDGALYALIAFLIFSQAYLGGDEAAKYIAPVMKFWLNYVVGGLAAFFGSVKMFRSTGFAEHQKQKNGDTQFIKKP